MVVQSLFMRCRVLGTSASQRCSTPATPGRARRRSLLRGSEQVRPGVALAAQARQSLAAGEPAMTGAALLAEPCFPFEPERQTAAWMRRSDVVQFILEPSFDQASRAAGSALGCNGWALCRDRVSRFAYGWAAARTPAMGCAAANPESIWQRVSVRHPHV